MLKVFKISALHHLSLAISASSGHGSNSTRFLIVPPKQLTVSYSHSGQFSAFEPKRLTWFWIKRSYFRQPVVIQHCDSLPTMCDSFTFTHSLAFLVSQVQKNSNGFLENMQNWKSYLEPQWMKKLNEKLITLSILPLKKDISCVIGRDLVCVSVHGGWQAWFF